MDAASLCAAWSASWYPMRLYHLRPTPCAISVWFEDGTPSIARRLRKQHRTAAADPVPAGCLLGCCIVAVTVALPLGSLRPCGSGTDSVARLGLCAWRIRTFEALIPRHVYRPRNGSRVT